MASCSLLTRFDGFGGGDAAVEASPANDSGIDTQTPAADGAGLDTQAPPTDASGLDALAPDGASDAPLDAPADALDAPPGADAPAGSYRSTILADMPLAYWRFGESSGALAYDETGNVNNEAYLGTGVTWSAAGAILGDPDTAIHLDGTHGLEVPTGFDFPGNLPYSLEAWVNLDMPLDGNYRHLFIKDQTIPTGREEYGVYMREADGLTLERYVMGTSVHISGPAPLVGLWSYVVATFDGAQLRLYLDGNLVATAPDARAQASKNAPEYLGCKNFNYVSVQGSLDDFAIYGYALSATQVAAHRAASGR
jgi:hypothetical protein